MISIAYAQAAPSAINNPVASFLPLILIAAVIFILLRGRRKWKKIKTYDEYLSENPSCITKNGVKCVHCGSNSIRNHGVNDAADANRIHICNHCGKVLYRSKMKY